MRRQINEVVEEFQRELCQALAELAVTAPGIELWADPAWRDLLQTRGWTCPAWPQSWGGTGWSAEEKFVWYRACHEIFADYIEPPEIQDVGPCLGRWGNKYGRSLLASITTLEANWSLALFEASLSVADVETELSGSGQLNGWKTEVRFAQRADNLLVVAKQADKFVLLEVPKAGAGVIVQPSTGLSGTVEMSNVQFIDVSVAAEQICGVLDSAEALRLLCYQTVGLELGRSGVIRKQLDAVNGAVGSDDEFANTVAEHEISLQALVVMEARVVAAAATGLPAPIPWSLLQARGLALQLKVGELLVDAFGYYAIPYPDEVSLHNEGPIGLPGGLSASRAMLRATEQVNYANLAGDLYDIAAVELLGDADQD
jgi:alkylation response protein AidB-like acyl-CoA dehydrogenase